MTKRPMLALIAHDTQKTALLQLVAQEEQQLRSEFLVATKTTGQLIAAAGLHLAVGTVESGTRGGDLQIAAGIIEGKVDGVIFLHDQQSSHPHQADIDALHRVAALYGIPIATTKDAARVLIRTRRRKRELRRVEPTIRAFRQNFNAAKVKASATSRQEAGPN